MKQFLVTGTPRSGTTFLCSKLAALDNVYMLKTNDYEPFNPWNSILDEQQYITSLRLNHPDKIVGLKTFWGDSFLLNEHIKTFDPIILIRKNIQKVYLSALVLYRKGYDENKSSKNRGSDNLNYSDFSLQTVSHNILKTYYYSENMPYRFKLYFEDLGKHNPLEDYFERSFDLNTKYNDNHDLTEYDPDPERFISFLKKTALAMDYKKLPSYVRENLNI